MVFVDKTGTVKHDHKFQTLFPVTATALQETGPAVSMNTSTFYRSFAWLGQTSLTPLLLLGLCCTHSPRLR